MRSWSGNKILRKICKHSLGRRLLAHVGPHHIQASVSGFDMILDLQDRWGVSKYILKHGDYDPELTSVVKDNLKEGATCLDVGANIGFWTCFLLHNCRAAQVISIEPEPGNARLLHENARLNGVDSRVEIHQLAVGASDGKLNLYLSQDNAGDHQLYATVEKRTQITVDVRRLDDLVAGRKIDFIKMDIQGYEPFALKGMVDTLASNPNLMMLTEFWPAAMQRAGAAPQDFLQYLSSLGFRFYLLDRERGFPRKVGQGEVACIPGPDEHIDLLLSRCAS